MYQYIWQPKLEKTANNQVCLQMLEKFNSWSGDTVECCVAKTCIYNAACLQRRDTPRSPKKYYSYRKEQTAVAVRALANVQPLYYSCPTFSMGSLYIKKNTSDLDSSVRGRGEVCFGHFWNILFSKSVCFSCRENVTWTQTADLSGYAQSIQKLSSEHWPWNYCPNLINGLEISYPTVRMDH